MTALISLGAAFNGCSTEPKSAEGKATLKSSSGSALDRFDDADPTLRPRLEQAAGYAIFPEIKKAGAGVGGAYGRGELYENRVKTGYCDVSAATLGLQLGVEAYSELIVFRTREALDAFKAGQLAFAANASAVAVKSGAAAAARHSDGVAVFVYNKGGLMAEASVGGQRFTYVPLRAADSVTTADESTP